MVKTRAPDLESQSWVSPVLVSGHFFLFLNVLEFYPVKWGGFHLILWRECKALNSSSRDLAQLASEYSRSSTIVINPKGKNMGSPYNFPVIPQVTHAHMHKVRCSGVMRARLHGMIIIVATKYCAKEIGSTPGPLSAFNMRMRKLWKLRHAYILNFTRAHWTDTVYYAHIVQYLAPAWTISA